LGEKHPWINKGLTEEEIRKNKKVKKNEDKWSILWFVLLKKMVSLKLICSSLILYKEIKLSMSSQLNESI
jgi:hypothetical protein